MAMTSTPTRRRIKTGTKARRTKALVRCGGAGGARTRDRQVMRKPTRFTSSLAGELLTASPLVSRDAPGLAAMSRNWPGRDGCSHNVLTRRYPVEVANLRRMTSRHGECPANRRGWPGTRHSGSACGDLSRFHCRWDLTVTKRRSTPSGTTSRYGACACMTPRIRPPRCSIWPSGHVPASFRPQAPAA